MSLHPVPHPELLLPGDKLYGSVNGSEELLLEGIHGGEQTLREAVLILRKHALSITLCALVALLLGLGFCYLTVPQYTATATVLVDKEAGLDLGALASSIGAGDDAKIALETQVSMIGSTTTALAVANRLDLLKVAPFHPAAPILPWKKPAVYRDTATLDVDPVAQAAFLGQFAGNLKVESKENTRLILVHFTNPNPAEAARIANTVVDVYLQQYLETRFRATAHASDWVSGQLGSLKTSVQDSQRKAEDYAHRNGLGGIMVTSLSGSSSGSSGGSSDSGGGSQLPEVAKLALLNSELTAAEANRIEKEAIYHFTQTKNPDVVAGLAGTTLAMSSGSTVISDKDGLSQLNALRLQQAGLRLSYTEAASKYGKQNPRLLAIEDQLRSFSVEIDQELTRISDRARADYQLALRTEDSLRASYKEQQADVEKLTSSATQLEVLATEAAASRRLYQGLVTTLQEANVQAGVQASNINLVDPARTPVVPTKPNWRTVPLFCFAAGLFVGVAIAFTVESLDDVIRNPDQVGGLTRLPVLASIPIFSVPVRARAVGARVATAIEPSLLITKPQDPISEAYRGLRTSIEMSSSINNMRSLLITSPLGGDGKTTVSYNLAIALAQQGKRVMIMDVDMRKPRLHYMIGIGKTPGLSDILALGKPWKDTVRQHPTLQNLSLIPAGTLPPMPSELLSLPGFDTLLTNLLEDYDFVLLDSPPLLLVTDALILSTKVSGTLLVIHSGITMHAALRRALEVLGRGHGRTLGFVLNGIDTRSTEYYSSYGYYGNKGSYAEEGLLS